MPIVDAKPRGEGGYGCNCPSFRRQKADKTLFPSLVKAANVEVTFIQKDPDGSMDFRAQTNGSQDSYQVTYVPGTSGGWCKHVAACVAFREPFLQRTVRQVEKEASEWHSQKQELMSQIKTLTKELKKLSKP